MERIYPNCIVSDEVEYTDPKSIATVLNIHFATIGQILADKLCAVTSTYVAEDYLYSNRQFNILSVYESFVIKYLKSVKSKKGNWSG